MCGWSSTAAVNLRLDEEAAGRAYVTAAMAATGLLRPRPRDGQRQPRTVPATDTTCPVSRMDDGTLPGSGQQNVDAMSMHPCMCASDAFLLTAKRS